VDPYRIPDFSLQFPKSTSYNLIAFFHIIISKLNKGEHTVTGGVAISAIYLSIIHPEEGRREKKREGAYCQL